MLRQIISFFISNVNKNHQVTIPHQKHLQPRQTLTRQDMLEAIRENGGLEYLNLSSCDFSGADLSNLSFIVEFEHVFRSPRIRDASFIRSNLAESRFHGCDLAGSRFYKANLNKAELSVTDLRGADFTQANLQGADFYLARLSGAIFNNARLERADLWKAMIQDAYISGIDVIGERLIQEDEEQYREYLSRYTSELGEEWFQNRFKKRYQAAGEIYRSLEQAFQGSGNHSAAVWAYRKARRMEKRWTWHLVLATWREGNRLQTLRQLLKWLSDWIIEILCDYGESVWRVIAWIIVLLLALGPLLVFAAGGLYWPQSAVSIYNNFPTVMQKSVYFYYQYLLYMIDIFTTADFSSLQPTNDIVRLISGVIALIAIFLVGLLGFVAGNRIRYSS